MRDVIGEAYARPEGMPGRSWSKYDRYRHRAARRMARTGTPMAEARARIEEAVTEWKRETRDRARLAAAETARANVLLNNWRHQENAARYAARSWESGGQGVAA